MVHSIQNNSFSASFSSKGGELLSFFSKRDRREYIWQSDRNIWGWHAPVLFPQCGNFPNGFVYIGKSHVLPMHGFLRDVEHTASGSGRFAYYFPGSDDYPFSFAAFTTFILEENALIHRLEIKNTSRCLVPCSLGFHTGYSISSPLVTFEKEDKETGGRCFKCSDVTLSETKLFTEIKSRSFILEGEEGKKIRISSPDFSTLVIWSQKGHARDFVCIEPRFDTVPLGAKDPFGKTIGQGDSLILEEKIEILG